MSTAEIISPLQFRQEHRSIDAVAVDELRDASIGYREAAVDDLRAIVRLSHVLVGLPRWRRFARYRVWRQMQRHRVAMLNEVEAFDAVEKLRRGSSIIEM